MVDVQAQVARWVTEQKHCADTVALKGARMLETDKGAGCQLDFVSCSGFLRSFTCRCLGFPSQKTWSSCTRTCGGAAAEEALQQKSAEERQRVEELRAVLEKLTAQESRLPPEAERLTQQLTQSRSLVVQREAGCETSLASKEQKLAELDKGCALYRTRLGLAFERVGDERLRLTFTNIDP